MSPPPPAAIAPTSRRAALKLAMLGLAASGTPVLGRQARSFTHGVASGEPGPRQVLLWTRYDRGQDVKIAWEVSQSEDFAKVIAHG